MVYFIAVILILILFGEVFKQYKGWDWLTHRSMNRDSRKPFKYVTFEQFLEKYNEYNEKYCLKKSELYDGIILSLPYEEEQKLEWNPNYRVYIHAGIIQFDGDCMIIKFKDYRKFVFWFDNFLRENKM